MTTDTQASTIDALLKELQLTFDATFVPMKQEHEKYPQLHWKVTIGNKKGHSLTTDYRQGMGHVKGYKQHWNSSWEAKLHAKAARRTCETGRLCRIGQESYYETTKRQPKPELKNVLYCLVMDSSAIDETFEDWCGNFGYDTDSRKALDTFMLCQNIGIQLRQIVGGYDKLEQLREAYQNY